MISPQLPASRRDSRFATLMMANALALAVIAAALSGFFQSAEHRIEELTFSALSRPASGQVHVVEMDAASIAAIRRWPWPRDHYARALAALDAAGVRSITFDVDFSSDGDAAGDRAFAQSLATARAPVALATFEQTAGSHDGRQLDSLPIPALRDSVHLASVSVAPDRDGLLREMPLGTITDHTARPSLSAFVAGRAGTADEHYPIDFAIDPDTIPRHSFIAIERGRIPAGALAGKDVIIGATAIELGDRYAVPRLGVVPGVIIQAIGAETLASGVPAFGPWWLLPMIAALLTLVVLTAPQRGTAMLHMGCALLLMLTAWIVVRLAANIWLEIVPAMAMIIAAGGLRYVTLTQRMAALARQIDTVSGLPNRHALAERQPEPDDRFVVVARIDDFDSLKLAVAADRFGPLVQRIAERLQVASGGVMIYRTEDHVLAWVSPLPITEVEAQLAGIRALMRSPFEIAGRRLGVSLTFGVADCLSGDPASNAAHAAHAARRAGKSWRLHSAEAGDAAAQQFSLLGELDGALRQGHIAVLYQPKLNLATQEIDAAEALVRWNHPERGMLPPDCFIPLIEEAGRIDDLTLAVLGQTLADMRQWQAGGLRIGAAVNISAALLTSDSFADRAMALVEQSRVPAPMVTFEVTESAQFEDTDRAIAMLERFRRAGIRISMDDYGTGQSALNYLKLLPLSELKIDRMFVANAHADRGDAMLVRSTVQLAHELGLKVVAEGIEDPACLAFLEQIGCDYAQGYFIGKPLAADEIAGLAAASVPSGSAPLPIIAAA